MTFLGLIVVLVVVGIIMWLVNTYIPMDPKIKKILNIAVVVILILWLLNVVGFFGMLGTVHIGHL
jgi:hypothetical protein